MASICRIGYFNGAAPVFTGASETGVSAETGSLKFGRDDTLASSATVPIPTATGTNYSWIKNLGIEVTTTAPTTISNRRIYVATAQSDVQTVATTGVPTGGTFTLTFNGQTTAAINFNDSAATVQTRLQALTTIGSGNATCSGGPLTTAGVVVTFAGTLANMPQALITLGTNSLTGGTTPSVSITHTTTGVQALSGTTGLDLYYKSVASGSYAQAASGNMPAAAGTNDALPSTYTRITTSAVQWDNSSVSANTQGLNGPLCVMVLGVDNQYVSPPGQALSSVTLPTIYMMYDEA